MPIQETNLYLETLRKLLMDYTANLNVKIYLFGSRAKGKASARSDIDLAILPMQPLPPGFMALLREKIEESTIPYFVDFVDLSQVDESFRQKVFSEGVEWKGSKNGC